MRFDTPKLGSRATRALTLAGLLIALTAGCGQSGRSLGRARAGDGGLDLAGGAVPDALPSGGSGGDVYLHPSAPAGAEGAFGGPPNQSNQGAPALVYPLAEAMLATNTNPLTVQWRRPEGAEIFRVRLWGAKGESLVYAGAGACPSNGCVVSLPPAFWKRLSEAHAGDALSITVDAVAAAGAPVFSSGQRIVHVAPMPLQGAITYWSSSINGIVKQAFGESPSQFLSGQAAPAQGRCVGCHAVSRDGCLTSAATEVSAANRQLIITDTQANTRSLVPGNETVFQAWSPDRQYLLSVLHGKVSIRDARGVWLDELPLSLLGEGEDAFVSHAAWSPDGAFLVFTRLPAEAQVVDPMLFSGDIVKVPFRGIKDYGPAVTLVSHTSTEYNFYPSVSPDGRWIVFATGSRPDRSYFTFTEPQTNFSAYAQQSARLRLVSSQGGAPVELGRATSALNSAASWPAFAPTSQKDGTLHFIVFSAKLDYGFLLQQAAMREARGRSLPGLFQIWVAGLDLNRPGDPSFAPFWLPQQPLDEVNHHGQWSTALPTPAACGF